MRSARDAAPRGPDPQAALLRGVGGTLPAGLNVPLVPIDRADDPRLAPFTTLRDPAHRLRTGLFVAESREVVRQLLASTRFRTRAVLTTASGAAALADALAARPEVPVWVAPPPVLTAVAGEEFHRGCVALGERGDDPPLDAVVTDATRHVLVLDEVSNPDNVGGCFRNARTLGGDAVLLSAGSADPLYRKVVRVGIGAPLHVPFTRLVPWEAGLARLATLGFVRVALVARGGEDPSILATLGATARVALLLGAEGPGLRPETRAVADRLITIRMTPGVDSLNVATACAIALHRLGPRESR